MGSVQDWNPHASVICPYDPLHVVSASRYQGHVVKCRKNHPDKDFVSCPFNAQHIFLRPEIRLHLAMCPDRCALDPDVPQAQCPETGEVMHLKGNTSLPISQHEIPDQDEDWDAEIEHSTATNIRTGGNISLEKEAELATWLRSCTVPILRKPGSDLGDVVEDRTIENGVRKNIVGRVLKPNPYPEPSDVSSTSPSASAVNSPVTPRVPLCAGSNEMPALTEVVCAESWSSVGLDVFRSSETSCATNLSAVLASPKASSASFHGSPSDKDPAAGIKPRRACSSVDVARITQFGQLLGSGLPYVPLAECNDEITKGECFAFGRGRKAKLSPLTSALLGPRRISSAGDLPSAAQPRGVAQASLQSIAQIGRGSLKIAASKFRS